MGTPLAFIDTETTGLDPDQHQIWEVAAIIEREGITEEYEWQLPVYLGRADPMALKIGRFYDRRRPARVLAQLADFAEIFALRTEGCRLVGAVVSFDEERLRGLLRQQHQCPMWHYHLIDVEALAAGWLAGRSCDAASAEDWLVKARPPWDSNKLSKAVGVDPEKFDRHTALGDARWARAVYLAVMGGGG
jgi:DNA polymerase III epsilon subunit-like protein